MTAGAKQQDVWHSEGSERSDACVAQLLVCTVRWRWRAKLGKEARAKLATCKILAIYIYMGIAEAVLLRRRYAVMKDAARAVCS